MILNVTVIRSVWWGGPMWGRGGMGEDEIICNSVQNVSCHQTSKYLCTISELNLVQQNQSSNSRILLKYGMFISGFYFNYKF